MDSSIESAAAANGSGEQLASQLYVAAMLASMKTEFPPGPPLVYGHGFGPPVPGLVLDLSPTAPASAASQQRSLLLPPVDQSPHTPGTYLRTIVLSLSLFITHPRTLLEILSKHRKRTIEGQTIEIGRRGPVGFYSYMYSQTGKSLLRFHWMVQTRVFLLLPTS